MDVCLKKENKYNFNLFCYLKVMSYYDLFLSFKRLEELRWLIIPWTGADHELT